jgi:hypothetical protein
MRDCERERAESTRSRSRLHVTKSENRCTKVLFGADYPISHFRGRGVTGENSFQWIYADQMCNPAMTLIGVEFLLSRRWAAEEVGLGPSEIERVFLGSAPDMLGTGQG